ncbi:hypothetical protein BWQ96_09751 [Gracilariopsis chorda]|uniref:Type VII secretion system protein EssD-like domain-containing protein n=1 Tax=Gracilariopsis chorda TaxID=448386 RepID=A0A2V3IEM0_9FLOR|nr:hypothetical protein BWQ96_09751 [Gracilariopsis chorda]|eukprot:PXF40536.1 hypothetical protein BWQ96_09751 [Gracilariopsis chorda]
MKLLIVFSLVLFCYLSSTCSAQSEKLPDVFHLVNTTHPPDFDDQSLPILLRAPKRSAKDIWIQKYKACGGNLVISTQSGNKPAMKITATIVKSCLAIGSKVRIPKHSDIYGWDDFKKFVGNKRKRPGSAPLWARCHIIAKQLGGRGNAYANLFPCWQTEFNHPRMSQCEAAAVKAVKQGKKVVYEVTLEYGSSNPWPTAIKIKATASGKKLYNVRIENTQAAKLTNI